MQLRAGMGVEVQWALLPELYFTWWYGEIEAIEDEPEPFLEGPPPSFLFLMHILLNKILLVLQEGIWTPMNPSLRGSGYPSCSCSILRTASGPPPRCPIPIPKGRLAARRLRRHTPDQEATGSRLLGAPQEDKRVVVKHKGAISEFLPKYTRRQKQLRGCAVVWQQISLEQQLL